MKTRSKIFISSIATLAVSAVPISTAVSCGEVPLEDKVYLVTDGGSIDDKSFNEQAANATMKILGYEGKLKSEDFNAPTGHSSAELQKGYEVARSAGRKYVIAPGYYHGDAVKAYTKDYKKQYFIMADNNVEGSTYKDNAVGIIYQVEQTGFLAGILASKYLNEIKKDADPKVGTWGGSSFAGVTSFMVGFIHGVKYYNSTLKGTADKKVEFVQYTNDKDYTNTDFVPGGGKTQAEYLVNNGVDIILPVAGPQTNDAIEEIKKQGKEAEIKIVGVDTNQADLYDKSKDLFLSSILKDLETTIPTAYDMAVNKKSLPWGTNYIGTLDNDGIGLAAPSFVAEDAANTTSVKTIYEDIMKNDTLLKEAKAISKLKPKDPAKYWEELGLEEIKSN